MGKGTGMDRKNDKAGEYAVDRHFGCIDIFNSVTQRYKVDVCMKIGMWKI